MMKLKKKIHKKSREKNLSQFRLTRLTHHMQHETEIKKNRPPKERTYKTGTS